MKPVIWFDEKMIDAGYGSNSYGMVVKPPFHVGQMYRLRPSIFQNWASLRGSCCYCYCLREIHMPIWLRFTIGQKKNFRAFVAKTDEHARIFHTLLTWEHCIRCWICSSCQRFHFFVANGMVLNIFNLRKVKKKMYWNVCSNGDHNSCRHFVSMAVCQCPH